MSWGGIIAVTGVGFLILLYAKKASGTMTGRPLKLYEGVVSPEMQAWAISIKDDPKTTYGDTFARNFAGVSLVAKVEHHTWTYRNGVRTEGNFKGVTLYVA